MKHNLHLKVAILKYKRGLKNHAQKCPVFFAIPDATSRKWPFFGKDFCKVLPEAWEQKKDIKEEQRFNFDPEKNGTKRKKWREDIQTQIFFAWLHCRKLWLMVLLHCVSLPSENARLAELNLVLFVVQCI